MEEKRGIDKFCDLLEDSYHIHGYHVSDDESYVLLDGWMTEEQNSCMIRILFDREGRIKGFKVD